ncbi:MAG TPA: pyruvate kinase alpha/beta domain-containing protein, partial [Bacteroidia bacterium]|nr:pyruvate kinase alpha/beta domain-containing protein [Bacteroidia bacterium]
RISSQRPKAGLFIFTDYKPILNTLNLVWGVRGIYYNKFESTDQTIDDIKNILKEQGYVDAGDVVIHVASTPLKKRSRVNTLKINVVD